MTKSLGEALPEEISRCREILGQYRAIGPAGAFGAAMIEADLKAADQAMISGDVVGMIQVYEKLKEYES